MKQSIRVAVGGLSAALCLLLMFMTGLVPFSSYLFPSMAGVVLIAVAHEAGAKTGLLVYVVTSLLALMIVPDREAVILFIMLLGYYPMLKPKLDRLPFLARWPLKLLLMNAAVGLFYLVVRYVFAIPDMDRFEVGIYVILGLVNFTFLMYDFLLTQILLIYTRWFRPKILMKIF